MFETCSVLFFTTHWRISNISPVKRHTICDERKRPILCSAHNTLMQCLHMHTYCKYRCAGTQTLLSTSFDIQQYQLNVQCIHFSGESGREQDDKNEVAKVFNCSLCMNIVCASKQYGIALLLSFDFFCFTFVVVPLIRLNSWWLSFVSADFGIFVQMRECETSHTIQFSKVVRSLFSNRNALELEIRCCQTGAPMLSNWSSNTRAPLALLRLPIDNNVRVFVHGFRVMCNTKALPYKSKIPFDFGKNFFFLLDVEKLKETRSNTHRDTPNE